MTESSFLTVNYRSCFLFWVHHLVSGLCRKTEARRLKGVDLHLSNNNNQSLQWRQTGSTDEVFLLHYFIFSDGLISA